MSSPPENLAPSSAPPAPSSVLPAPSSAPPAPSTALPGINKAGMIGDNPRDSAIANTNNNAELLASLNTVGGKRRRRRIYGGFQTTSDAPAIVVPIVEPLYPSTLTGSQSTNGQIVGNATTITTNTENAKYDALAASPQPIPANQLQGGKRLRKSRKSRKSRKPRKSRKSRKSRKTRKH